MTTYAGTYNPTQMSDANGKPLLNLPVSIYNHGTQTLATLYTDNTKAHTANNPTSTDANGNLQFFAAPGAYDISGDGLVVGPVVLPLDPAEPTGSQSGALLATHNLSDVNSASTSRTNLGLGTSATEAVSTSAADFAADQTGGGAGAVGKVSDAGHQHPPSSLYLKVANNLSDLGSLATALSNLGVGFNVVAESAAYNARAQDIVLATAGAGGFTVTLPAPALDIMVLVKKVDSGAGTVTVSQHASETIDGNSSLSLILQYDHCWLVSDGTNWFDVGAYTASASFESAVETLKLNQLQNPNGAVNMGSNQINALSDGINATDAATLEQTQQWVQDTNAWTRTANTTFTTAANTTAIFGPGVVVKWKESGVQKYGVVASSAFTTVTTVTLVSTTDYVMAANPDANTNYYSYGVPRDFPNSFTWSGIGATGISGSLSITLATFTVKPGRRMLVNFNVSGTSNANSFTLTGLPISSSSTGAAYGACTGIDNNDWTPASLNIAASSSSIVASKVYPGVSLLTATWTTSNSKGLLGQIEYGF